MAEFPASPIGAAEFFERFLPRAFEEAELPPGPRKLTVQAPGHAPLKTEETITANQGVSVVYRLEPLVVDPYETVVRGERERTELSRHTLQAQELRLGALSSTPRMLSNGNGAVSA